MKIPPAFASLFIAAGAAFIPASAVTAAPLAGPLALRAAAAGEFEQVQYRYRYPRSAYRSYAYAPGSAYRSYGYYGYGAYRGYGPPRCSVTGDDSTTSSYPSWMVCHLRYGQWGTGDE